MVLATHQVHFAMLANKLLVLKDVCVFILFDSSFPFVSCYCFYSWYPCVFIKGKVEAYNSFSELVADGFDTTQLLGLISAGEAKRSNSIGRQYHNWLTLFKFHAIFSLY